MYNGTMKSTFITVFNVDMCRVLDLLHINNIPTLAFIPEADTIVIQQGNGERAEFKITQAFPEATIHMNTLNLQK